MFEERNVKILNQRKTDKTQYFRIQNKDFVLWRSCNVMSKEEFLELANKTYMERFGKEANYRSIPDRKANGKPLDGYELIIKNRYSSIQQRAINGKYSNEKTIKNNLQHNSYHKKGITVDMSFEEFRDWMKSVEHIHNEIVASGERSSINRIDSRLGYCVGNLELISLHKNIEERYQKKCRYMTDSELAEKSVINCLSYLNSQRGN